MLDGPEEKKQLMQQQQQRRQMLNGPQDRKPLYAGQRDRRNTPVRSGGPRTINGVVISSDDGDNRIIHGSFRSEEEMEALKREKIKENQARHEAEKREAAKKAAEEANARYNELLYYGIGDIGEDE
jgi:hypothetical protein